MKMYRNYTAKKLKFPKRLLFFVICALIIFIAAILLGLNLKSRMENADIDRTPVETKPVEDPDKDDGIAEGTAEHDSTLASVRAGYLELTGITEIDGAKKQISALRDDGYNCISYFVTKDGRLTYASAAAEEYSRLPASEAIVSFEMLTDAVAYAESLGMRTSAFYETGSLEELDLKIISELSGIGFDEIIISGFEDLLGEDGGEIASFVGHMAKVRECANGAAVSVCFSTDAYTYARNSYQIEKIFTYTEFLTIDIREMSSEETAALCESIAGSFQSYMLRPIVWGETDGIGEILAENGVNSVQYASPVPDPDATSDSDSSADTDEGTDTGSTDA